MRFRANYRFKEILLVVILAVIVLGAVFLVMISVRQPMPISGEVITPTNNEKSEVNFAWPTTGRATIGTLNGGLKATYGGDEQYPTASLAKVITALVVLAEKPIEGDGPMITITDEDVALYNQTVAVNGSRLYVEAGEQLSQRQMLEALMLPSANNIAGTLVRWAFGSHEDYRAAAEKWLVEHELYNTTIGLDASGLDPSTTSNTSDLFEITRLAINDPTLGEIVRESSAVFPLVGEVPNTNALLRDNAGYIGVKTGNTEEARTCLMFAVERTVGGLTTTIIGALTGLDYGTTFNAARALTDHAVGQMIEYKIPAGTIVGKYQIPWSGTINAVTRQDIAGVVWRDDDPQVNIELDNIGSSIYDYRDVGVATIGDQSTNVKLDGVVLNPDFTWKITNLSSLRW